ncbi:hypothetical protein Bhyg_14765 [Pseudolycoriella hygida]|uniref:Uncharacterized protein n=1 Tax=Pseudolycoriella hygida TaxID=35572 RepID=A0A9Q0RXH3_9DIPT|nr:hypothetical protein Bhyg_14765 [Pseudolycoriella hygida]
MLKLLISLLIGLIFARTGLCQVFETQDIASEDDLTASAATLFGPKTFGIRHANLGSFGPLGYGGIGGMRLGSIGPFRFGHIGGIHADSFLGASNPNSEEDKSPGSTGIPSGGDQHQENVASPLEQNWEGTGVQENIVGMEQGWQGINDQGNNMGVEQGLQGLDRQENIVGMEQSWKAIDGQQNNRQLEQNFDGQENIVRMEQGWQQLGGQENIVGMEQGWQQLGGQENIEGMEQGWQQLGGQENILGMEQGWQQLGGQENIWQLGLQPQVAENSRAFLNDGLFGLKKIDKIEKIPPKPALPPNSHSSFHTKTIFRNALNELDQPQVTDDQLQQFNEINNAMQMPTITNQYQPAIIVLEDPSYSPSSARSSVDDMITGLEDTGFDFELRDYIEDAFLTPYLGLLDPNDLMDDGDDALLLL